MIEKQLGDSPLDSPSYKEMMRERLHAGFDQIDDRGAPRLDAVWKRKAAKVDERKGPD